MWLSEVERTEGWLSLREARMLHDAALTVHSGPILAVEIGSWKGRSTIAIASGLKERGGTLLAIDPHTGSREHQPHFIGTYDDFMRNIQQAGLEHVVRPIRSFSRDARSQVSDDTVSVLFIDGSHEYEDVLQDIVDWLPTLREGAVVAFNDYEWPGVYRALLEKVAVAGGALTKPQFVRGSLFMRREGRLSPLQGRVMRARLRAGALMRQIKNVMPRRILLALRALHARLSP